MEVGLVGELEQVVEVGLVGQLEQVVEVGLVVEQSEPTSTSPKALHRDINGIFEDSCLC